MKCPVCNIELRMSERQGIEIDYCPECRGVWLDRGELDKVIERSLPVSDVRDCGNQAEPYRYNPSRYTAVGGHGHTGDRPHKKKSLLGELFDFG